MLLDDMIHEHYRKRYCCRCGSWLRVEATTLGGLTAGFYEAGWMGIDGKQYCPDCYFFDEKELKYKPKP